jgi:hypothetical protein
VWPQVLCFPRAKTYTRWMPKERAADAQRRTIGHHKKLDDIGAAHARRDLLPPFVNFRPLPLRPSPTDTAILKPRGYDRW